MIFNISEQYFRIFLTRKLKSRKFRNFLRQEGNEMKPTKIHLSYTFIKNLYSGFKLVHEL